MAALARLALTEEELDRFTEQLAQVLDHAADVASLDLAGVAPTAHALAVTNVLRARRAPSLPRPRRGAGRRRRSRTTGSGCRRILGEAP